MPLPGPRGPERCLDALRSLGGRPHGVVLFPDASRDAGGYEHQVAAWGREHGVAVLGPQSNGLVSLAGRLHGLLIPVVEDLRAGGVALLAQSGGVLGGLVKYLAQRRVGLHSALEYGTGCMLTMEGLAGWLLALPEVRTLGIYADGVERLDRLADVVSGARAAGRAVVLMAGGLSESGHRAAASHSGAAATPGRVLEGLCEQHGAVLARSLDELAWSLEVLAERVPWAPAGASEVAVFSDSGGAGITLADALELHGVPVPEGQGANPFDFGSASMGESASQADAIRAVAGDGRYGVFAFASPIGLPRREQSVHQRQLDDFVAAVRATGRLPFVASLFPFDRLGAAEAGAPPHGLGSTESAVKIRALRTWAGGGTPAASWPAAAEVPAPAARPGEVLSGERAVSLLCGLPLGWPRQAAIASAADLDRLDGFSYPVVARTEAGLAHRAREGGVLVGIAGPRDLRNAVVYLLERFGGPVSVAEQVAHDEEWFVGAARRDGLTLVMLGRGGGQAESASVRVAPLSDRQRHRLVADTVGDEAFVGLLEALERWLVGAPWAGAVDLNPVVRAGDRLLALDAKVHVR
ncbi:MAG: hypothetical protein E6J41_15325 [Chloroflexi bacterium]|nr:MAG: hypothetical protein E6J41_15325 [Chloroflexota bacterium]